MSQRRIGASPIIDQAREPLTMDDLPAPNIARWITRRKAEVVIAVRTGLLGLEEACQRYGITAEEFFSWQRLLNAHGMEGLRATRLKEYRQSAQGVGRDGAHRADRDLS